MRLELELGVGVWGLEIGGEQISYRTQLPQQLVIRGEQWIA